MDKLKKLEEILKIADRDVPSTQEVADLVAQIIEVVRKAKEHLEKQARDNKTDLNRFVNRSLEEASIKLGEHIEHMEKMMKEHHQKMGKTHKEEMDTLTTELYKELKKLKDSIPSPTDLSDLYGKIEGVEKKIPALPTIDDIRDELELEVEDIKGLKEKIKELQKDIATTKSGGVRRVYQPYVDDFSALTDGSTKTFYLSREPLKSNTILVWGTDFPIILRYNTDFTVEGKKLTLTSAVPAPNSGSSLIVHFFS